jgi:hypothetical protein
MTLLKASSFEMTIAIFFLMNYSQRTHTYDAAAAKCATLGGRLPEIKSATENQYLRILMLVKFFY